MSDDKIKFYNIEAEHLVDLEVVARRLYAAPALDGAECHDAAMKIMGVINFAKTLHALSQPGKPLVHVDEHVFPELFKDKS